MLSASSQPPMVTSWARPAVIIFQPMFNFWVIIGFFMPNAAQISLIRDRFCVFLTAYDFSINRPVTRTASHFFPFFLGSSHVPIRTLPHKRNLFLALRLFYGCYAHHSQ